jgi:hypothetical protein
LTGGFISEDTIGFTGGDANLYRYVFNSPTNFTDPSGEFAIVIPIGLGGAALLLGGTGIILSNPDARESIQELPGLTGRAGSQIKDSIKRRFFPTENEQASDDANSIAGADAGAGTTEEQCKNKPDDDCEQNPAEEFTENASDIVDELRQNLNPGNPPGGLDEIIPNSSQQPNIKRFNSKIPTNAKTNVNLYRLPDGGIAAQATSPGKVPGSKAVYEKQIDASGKTLQYTKTTYDPKGNIVHVKDKITGEVFQPECN